MAVLLLNALRSFLQCLEAPYYATSRSFFYFFNPEFTLAILLQNRTSPARQWDELNSSSAPYVPMDLPFKMLTLLLI
ncbi:hypothetical protein C8R45DRAFT_1114005 [Mycena sanguinolenta]|nr:hypothetical protein C8R45DRAFT_1115877 [Mycena sanguinolenta]KAJ6450670.1 hypothetical protein C8R45DRAFT_1114005 [Mycena sanguinolenta]